MIEDMLSSQVLRQTVREMCRVYGESQRAIEKRFDEAMEDSTLSFYLQFKAAKVQAAQLKTHGIYSVLLRLKHRVDSLRKM